MSELTDAQLELVEEPGDRYVEACPGAGKTRAIVLRYLQRAVQEKRKGIALLSFTNAAVDEVRSRCKSEPNLLQAPHFVGTFDSFINRFIVGPMQAKVAGSFPTFIESWDAHDASYIKPIASEPYLRFSLEWFDIDLSTRSAKLNLGRVGGEYEARFAKEYLSHQARIDQTAWDRWNKRVARGYISCSASRTLMMSAIKHKSLGPKLRIFLASRFAEVIVDEAQDCGGEELELLTLLRECGVRVVLVCDPDQAIFEFRRATPERVRYFASQLTDGSRLSANFRSSPAICKLNKSLRTSGHDDHAGGKHASVSTPIILLPYESLDTVAVATEELIAECGLQKSNGIVISHKAKDCRLAVGIRSERNPGTKKVLIFARGWKTLANPASTSRERLKAVVAVEQALLGLVQGVDAVSETPERICNDLGINHRVLRSFVLRLVGGIDASTCDPRTYAALLRKRIQEGRWSATLPLLSLSDQLKAPTEEDWINLALGMTPSGLPWSTIHGVKGLEFPWVTVVVPKILPKDEDKATVVDHWDKGVESEARRVLYVGVSRAQQLLVLAVHRNHSKRIAEILERDHVPFKVHELRSHPAV